MNTNDNIRDMLNKTLDNNIDGFKASFDKEMSDRVAEKLAVKHVDITTDILNKEEDSNTE